MSIKMKQNPTMVMRSVSELHPYAKNARTHSAEQIAQVARSIQEFGWTNPVLVDKDGTIIAGHARVEAAKSIGIEAVPTIALEHLTPLQVRAYILADNQLALNAGWDDDVLRDELAALDAEDYDLELTGFSLDERDALMTTIDMMASDGALSNAQYGVPTKPGHIPLAFIDIGGSVPREVIHALRDHLAGQGAVPGEDNGEIIAAWIQDAI
jgi:hypothetical protein